jgi:hypothetical protein
VNELKNKHIEIMNLRFEKVINLVAKELLWSMFKSVLEWPEWKQSQLEVVDD